LAVNGGYLSTDAAAGATSLTVRAIGNITTGTAYLWDKNNPVGETVTISSISGTTLTLSAGITGSYTVAADAVITNFSLPIPGRWCKIAYVKIVQYQPGAMDLSFDIAEKSSIDEGVRRNLIYTIYKRNIDIDATGGGQYGEALSKAIPYFDRDDPGEERTYALHCRLQNEAGGTVSDFGIVIKLAEIGEAV